jgi:hypothetical protein
LSCALAPAREGYGLGTLPVGKTGAEVEAASLGVPELGPGVGPVAEGVGSPEVDGVGVGPVGEGSGDGEALGDGDGDTGVGDGDGDVVGAVGSGEGVTVGPVDGDADGDA